MPPIYAKKSLGQNFLTDRRVVARILESVDPQAHDIILEIGPGVGALTIPLASRAGMLRAVEADPRMIAGLRESLPDDQVQIVLADALDLDWGGFIEAALADWSENGNPDSPPRVRVVANLPYYISTAILQLLLQQHARLADLTLMLQEEVVDRIAAEPGRKEYGYLSVLVQYYCHIEKMFRVPPSAFSPQPKVWSAVVRLNLRDRPAVVVDDEPRFFALVRASFAQRRKMLLNNLKAAGTSLRSTERPIESRLEVPEIEATMRSVGIDTNRRAETLSLEEFARLFKALR